MSVDDDHQMAFPSTTVDEIVTSIQKLQGQQETRRYRAHLEELASQLFQKLATSNEPDAVIMTLLAATSCHHPLSRTISKELINSDYPVIQLAAIQALSALNTTDADYILIEALRSDYPIIRLEAAWRIACKRSNDAFYHIDALSHKLPEGLLSYMPELFAIEGSSNSLHRLRQFLFDPDEEVVIETLIATGRHHITGMSDLLVGLSPHSPATQEALAYGLRATDSEEARAKLHQLATYDHPCVQIQAALSLVFLGETEYQSLITDLAKKGSPFAAAALGECPEPMTCFDLNDHSRAFQINIALSLLNQKDPGCLEQLKSILSIPDDQILMSSTSIGRSLAYWDITPSEAFEKEAWGMMKEQSLVAKESILVQALELNEASFDELATNLFEEQKVDLYPCLLQLLENQRSETSIALLRREANRIGAPFNRAFATLTLVRLGIENDEAVLASILDFSRETDEQSWRPPLPWMTFLHTDEKSSQQQAAATAKLYIETIESLAERGTPESIQILTSELNKSPKKYLPFIVASLLHATI